MKKLRGVEQALANFFAQGLLVLGPKLGPILWQLPPRSLFDEERFSAFFNLLPRTTEQAASLALEHHPRMTGRAVTEALHSKPMRHCLEIRNSSCVCPEFIALLRKHNIGLVVADTVEWPLLFDITSDFVYCRLHGSEELYASGYGEAALDIWAQRVVQWAHGGEIEDELAGSRLHGHHASRKMARKRAARDVYVYFDNDAKVHAPFDAQHLRERVDLLVSAGA